MTRIKITVTRRIVAAGVLQWMLIGILLLSAAFVLLVVPTALAIPTLLPATATTTGSEETRWQQLPRSTGSIIASTGTVRGDPPPPVRVAAAHHDRSEQIRSHPNDIAVAYDEHGNPGYVHDPYFVKNNPLPFTFQADGHELCKEPVGEGQERRKGSDALRKIVIMTMPTQPHPRILCMVYSYAGRHDVVRAIAETYAPRCDGFLVASNQTDRTIGAVRLDHAGPESYSNMWQKVRSMWIYAYQHYLDDFEFFHMGGDNMWVIAENLRYAASQQNVTEPVYMGAAIVDRDTPQHRFCGGGAGYTLSREALRQMVSEEFHQARCYPTHQRSDEDVMMGTCLRHNVATCTQSNDEKDEPRYHHYDPERHVLWNRHKRSNWGWPQLLKYHHIIANKERLESISATSATFHLTTQSKYRDRGLRRYHALLYGLCGDQRKLVPLALNST